MSEPDSLEGSLVLEKLAEIGQVEAFYAAIDSDDFATMRRLMLRAGVDRETIEAVMEEAGVNSN